MIGMMWNIDTSIVEMKSENSVMKSDLVVVNARLSESDDPMTSFEQKLGIIFILEVPELKRLNSVIVIELITCS